MTDCVWLSDRDPNEAHGVSLLFSWNRTVFDGTCKKQSEEAMEEEGHNVLIREAQTPFVMDQSLWVLRGLI